MTATGSLRRKIRYEAVIHDGRMAMTEEETAERAALQRRIYGPDSTDAFTQAEVERLRTLESGGADDSTDAPASISTVNKGSGESAEPESTWAIPFLTPHRSWRHWLGVVVAGLAVTAVGYGVGYGVGALATTPKVSAILPEFGFDQTDEDLLPESFLANDDTLDPDSTRFVGRIDGYVIYLAEDAESDGVCVVALADGVQPEPVSMGCFSQMTSGAGASSGVTETLEIGVGERTLGTRGTPIRLSESVTAYRK